LPKKNRLYPLRRGLCGPHSQSERVGE
jgi:hypothetical protein